MNSDTQEFKSRGCCGVPNSYQKNENISQHSCCKLDAFDWLDDFKPLNEGDRFDCIEVRFKNSRKDFFRLTDDINVNRGDVLAVESSPGHDIGIVTLTGETARLQMRKKKVNWNDESIKKVYRKARQTDIEKWISAAALEKSTMVKTRRVVNDLGLSMKINDVEYQGDKTKAIFYYTAEERVDFRELIKILAESFSVRIEMKQIGVRQESSKLGGIGSCGRELCCSTWLTNFKSVSTVTARNQQLSLNPQKLAGQCGKLKCCINYELDIYNEEIKKFPEPMRFIRTKTGNANFIKMDILRGIMYYSHENNPQALLSLTREQVDNLQKMITKGIIPESLDLEIIEKPSVQFDNVIGQDDIGRFDSNSKNKNKKKQANRNNNQNNAQQPQQNQASTEIKVKHELKKNIKKDE